jgi:hypothetical protein
MMENVYIHYLDLTSVWRWWRRRPACTIERWQRRRKRPACVRDRAAVAEEEVGVRTW